MFTSATASHVPRASKSKGWLSLPNVARYWGVQPAVSADRKDEMQTRIAFDPSPFSDRERQDVLDYCADDVTMTAGIFRRQLSILMRDPDWLKTALWRGRYTPAVALMEWYGVPIDTELLGRLNRHWPAIMLALIEEMDTETQVFENGELKLARIDAYAAREGISWPRTKTGLPATNEKAFAELHDSYPQLRPLLTLISTRNKLKLHSLQVGPDARNRTLLGMFGSLTGRNQPSSAKYIFGPARWVRQLIKPGPGRAVALLDYKHEEPRIGAIMSGDEALLRALDTGDVYLALAKAAGLVPADATKDTHGPERHKAKQTFLGVGYGMEAAGLARRLDIAEVEAADLIRRYAATFTPFWNWLRCRRTTALRQGYLTTCFGWRLRVGAPVKPNTWRNFESQATGAEILRLAACLATEAGLEVCGPAHDAFLIESALETIDADTERMVACMDEAAATVLGSTIPIDINTTRYPDRFEEKDGAAMFARSHGVARKL